MYKLCIWIHRIEILGFLVYFMFLKKKKSQKNVILEFGNAFSVHFSKLSSRHQAKLINIYENFGVFIFHILPVSMRDMLLICDFMFRKSVSQYFCFQFLTSFSFWYPYVKKLHRVPYLAFRTNFFQKKYKRQNMDNNRLSITSCAQRDFISCDIIVDFWYCLACCTLYSIKSKETST